MPAQMDSPLDGRRGAEPTPGPWKFAGSEGRRARVEDPTGCLVALTRLALSPAEARTADANARLIAAAPEMLAALRVAADRLDQMTGNPEWAAPARAAIARAEGRA